MSHTWYISVTDNKACVSVGDDLRVTVFMSTAVTGMVDFVLKEVQNGPKWDKSGTFSDQISVHFGSIK